MTNKKTLTLLACIPRSRGHCLQRRKRPRGKKTAHAWRRGHHITSTYLSLTTLAQGPYDSWQLYNHSTSNPAPKGLDISFFATHELHGGESTPVARATFVTLGTDSRVNENHRRALDMLIRTIRQRPSSICVSILWNGYVLRFFFSAPPFCDESAVRKKLSVSKMLFFFTYCTFGSGCCAKISIIFDDSQSLHAFYLWHIKNTCKRTEPETLRNPHTVALEVG